MKKLLALFIIAAFVCPSCQAWSFRKNKQTPKTQQSEPVEIKEYDNYGSGYVGTLPDISGNFGSPEARDVKPDFEVTKQFNSANEVVPAPRDNPAFVNIILKTDKKSPCLNDINEILPQLENILYCIENDYDVQRFNAKVYFFNQNIEYLQEKYLNKPESTYVSFQKLITLNTHTKTIANLRSEAEKYKPYLAYTGAGYLYNENVINEQLDYLKTEIEETIVILKEAQ